MNYITIKETAKKWGVTDRQVQLLCKKGAVEGAQKFGRSWMIPENAEKPHDGRTKEGRTESKAPFDMSVTMPRKTPFLLMTDLYSKPGSAEESAERLSDFSLAKTLFEAEIAYARGDIDAVYQSANVLLKGTSFYSVLASGTLLALCAIWRGDLTLWRLAKVHIAEAPAENDADREIITLALTAVDCMLYDTSSFPEWFKIGSFEPLHKDALPSAKVFYAKYLYSVAFVVATRELEVDGQKGLSLMSVLPYIIEPMISQTMADSSVVAEIYLRFTCATAYHNFGNEKMAEHHVKRAIALALPDKLYGTLAEYCRVIYHLMEKCLTELDANVWQAVRTLYLGYYSGWTKLSGSVRGKHLITTLSPRERSVARLAAFGMQNSEIAEKLHMSLSGVKQAIRIISEKMGVSRDKFAAYL